MIDETLHNSLIGLKIYIKCFFAAQKLEELREKKKAVV